MNSIVKRSLFIASIIINYLYLAHAATISNKQVKVGIIPETSAVTISTSNTGILFLLSNDSMNKIASIAPRQSCKITNKNGLLEITLNNKTTTVPRGKLILKNTEINEKYSPLVFAGKHWYRGDLEIFPAFKNNKGITVVNSLPLEEYLFGVVPAEMPSSWPLEALKTQAVAARTYALAHLGQFGSEGFDVMPTTVSQVYGGVEEETPVTNQAVSETRGKVITYNSKLISAYYSASSGGVTESSVDAWGTDLPYIKSVQDFDQDSPKYTWYKTISNDDLQGIVKKEFGTDLGRITKFSIMDTTGSNRVKTLRIEGQKGYVDVDGKKFRTAAKLNSTLFRVQPVDPGTTVSNDIPSPNLYLFIGRGWGHGAGMSQWGARYMAKTGKTYAEILSYYYPGTEIVAGDNLLAEK
jgi:stage II sporulation protein D